MPSASADAGAAIIVDVDADGASATTVIGSVITAPVESVTLSCATPTVVPAVNVAVEAPVATRVPPAASTEYEYAGLPPVVLMERVCPATTLDEGADIARANDALIPLLSFKGVPIKFGLQPEAAIATIATKTRSAGNIRTGAFGPIFKMREELPDAPRASFDDGLPPLPRSGAR